MKDPTDKETLDLEVFLDKQRLLDAWLDARPEPEEPPEGWEDEVLWYQQTQGKL